MARNTSITREVTRRKRRGIHAKTKSSKLKNSKNYKKRYAGQGK